jgi:hypothetical protein
MRPGLVLLLAVLLLAACKGGEPDTTMGSTTTSTAALTTTVATIPATTSTTLPALVDTYDLGVGFHLGAADQTEGLFVEFTDNDAATRGDIPEVSVLPDGRWTAEVRIGHDLFASCDRSWQAPSPSWRWKCPAPGVG